MASTPSPIGTVVTTLPVSASITAIILLSQPENMRRVLVSIAMPDGSSHGASGHLLSNRQRLRIDLHHLALVFDVDVDVALAIGRGELGLSFQRHGARQRSFLGVHRGGAGAAAVERENTLGCRIVNDAVRIHPGRNLAHLRERLHIENHHLVRRAIADESVIEFGRERDAMHQLQARDVAGHFAFLAIHHIHFGAVRNEHAARRGIGGQVIPEAIAGNTDFPDLMVAALRERSGQNEQRN